MRPTDEKEVEQKIKAMKDNKTVGPNSIRTKILKVHSKTLSKPLAELINLSLNQGKFPTILKIAKVILIHKRGDKSECDILANLLKKQCMKDFIILLKRSNYCLSIFFLFLTTVKFL